MISQMSIKKTEEEPFSLPLRIVSKIISFVFHPLFIPLYLAWFFIYELRLFSDLNEWQRTIILIQFFIHYTFFPLMTTLLSKALGFVQSIYLKTQKDRIIPYVICMIFYFWNWYAFKNNFEVKDIVSMSMAIFNASVFGFLANIVSKVSMHAIAVGVMSTFIALLAFTDSISFSFYLSVAVIISGFVCTARLIVSDHSPKQIYYGFLIGVF